MQITQEQIDQYSNNLFQAGYGQVHEETWFTSKSPETQAEILEQGRTHAQKMAEEFARAIRERDIRALEVRLHTGNRLSCNTFQQITGIKLGRTNKSIREGIAKFTGDANYAQYKADRQAAAERKVTEARQKNEQTRIDAALAQRCRWLYTRCDDGTTTSGIEMPGTFREFILWLVENGFQPWWESKRGFRPALHVHDPSDRIRTAYVLDKKIQREYFTKLLAEKGQAAGKPVEHNTAPIESDGEAA